MRDLVSHSSDSLTYSSLEQLKRRSLINGGWARLEIADRGLFRCALWVAKARGRISNTRLIVQLMHVALKMLQSLRGRIDKIGIRRATLMCEEYAKPGGVFSWAPRMREWLHNASYVWYLGVMEVNR
jgi:hypothetical protein